jgi:DNA-binding NtrC family response regulator
MANILVVDDELGIRDLLSEILNDEGHNVELAENAAQARAARARARPDLVLLDIWMPDTDGVTLLKEWSTTGLLSMPVIMMSGHATIDTAVEATRIGAQSFLEKPITLQKLLKAVEQGPDPQRSRSQTGRDSIGVCDGPDRRSRDDRRPQPAAGGGDGPPGAPGV